jgi:3'-5' exoribonuclease
MNADRALPSPREWIGDAPFPWPPTLSIADGDDVAACFSLNRVTVGRTRAGDPFLKLQLTDCYGALEARMWDGVEDVADLLRAGMYVGVRGRLERYQEERQLRVESIEVLRVDLDDLPLFLPRSARPAERMDAELDALVRSVSDPALRALLDAILGAGTETGHAFRLAPAAKQNHHAYLGGLIEHTLSVASVCDMLATHYGAAVDRDLLIAGALLHDLGKVREIGARGGFPYTDEGKLLGHILIGLQMVSDAAAAVPGLAQARLLLLQHLIASHQGRYEWHSPREPRTLEAIILHYADDLDAKLNQAAALIDAVPAGWSAYDRGFARDFLRHVSPDSPTVPAAAAETGGRDGVDGAAARPDAAARGAPQTSPQTSPQASSPPMSSPPGPLPARPPREPGPLTPPDRDDGADTPPLDTLDLFEDS